MGKFWKYILFFIGIQTILIISLGLFIPEFWSRFNEPLGIIGIAEAVVLVFLFFAHRLFFKESTESLSINQANGFKIANLILGPLAGAAIMLASPAAYFLFWALVFGAIVGFFASYFLIRFGNNKIIFIILVSIIIISVFVFFNTYGNRIFDSTFWL